MLTYIKQKGAMFIVLLLFFLMTEMLTFHELGLGLFPKYLLLDILFLSVLTSVIFIIKSNKLTLVYLTTLVLVIVLLFLSNITIYKVFGDIFSIEKLFLLGEANQVFDWNFLSTWDIVFSCMIFIGFILVNIIMMRLFKYKKVKISFFKRVYITVPLFLFFIFFYACLVLNASKEISIRGERFDDTFFVTSLKKSAFDYYGMLSFYYKEVEIHLNQSPNYLSDDDDYTQAKSNYFGLLKDKNVITIMIESGQEMGINQFLTPNLYRIREEGLYFSENYSINKTNVSEHIGIVGNYPTSNYSFTTKDFTMPFTVPNILNDKYITSYFHDNNERFYHRGVLMEQLGFEHHYFHDDLFSEPLPNWEGKWSYAGDYTLDSVTIDKILPYMINENELFYSFWTTLSTHGPYSNNRRSNRDLLMEKGYFARINEVQSEGKWNNPLEGDITGEFQFEYYQATMMDLDIAVGKIIDELIIKDLLDDTILILYSDHHVYYHDLHLRLNDVKDNEVYKMDLLYDTILYFWNPTLNEVYEENQGTTTINTFTSPYIIVPTLLDLLGADYDSNWYLNYSVFSENYLPVFYSHQLGPGALFNNVLYTEDCITIHYHVKDKKQEYIEQFLKNCLKLLKRQNRINKLYISKEDDL